MIERSPADRAQARADDERIDAALDTATVRLTSWYLAEHYDPDVDSDHLLDALYNGLRDDLSREDLIRAVISCIEDDAAEAAHHIVAEASGCTCAIGERSAGLEPW